jgi:ferritin-like metal-binding protein YciE
MSSHSVDDQLTKYLTDVHSIELQALAQLEVAPDIAKDEQLAAAFRAHLEETREQERLVRQLLSQRGEDTSSLKDLAGKVGGWAMAAFARINPDTPGKLTAHAFSYEHMELAAYELLARVAARAGDETVVETARKIGAQEAAMAGRLADGFDGAVEASLQEKQASDLRDELVSYLTDAHAIEAQALTLLEAGPKLAGFEQLAEVFREHFTETLEHKRLLERRLDALDAHPSRIQDAGMRFGALNLGAFFGAQPDTPVKLAGFAFAFEHLEIAGYELLRRVAARAHDEQTGAVAAQILADEHRAAERIAATWDGAVETVLGHAAAAVS